VDLLLAAGVEYDSSLMARDYRMLGLEHFIAETRALGVSFTRQDDIARQVRAGHTFGLPT